MSEIIKRPPIEKDKAWALEETHYSQFRCFTIEQGLEYISYIESLESSLEKEEQAHVMSVYDLNMKIAELGIALEKEKETVLQLRTAWKMQDELWKKEKERAGKLMEGVKELLAYGPIFPHHIQEGLEKVLEEVKGDPSIGKLEIEGEFGEDD